MQTSKRHASQKNKIASLLGEVAQLGQLIQQLLQVSVGDFVLQTGNKRLGFLCIIAAQTSYLMVNTESRTPGKKNRTNQAVTARTSPARCVSSATAPPP